MKACNSLLRFISYQPKLIKSSNEYLFENNFVKKISDNLNASKCGPDINFEGRLIKLRAYIIILQNDGRLKSVKYQCSSDMLEGHQFKKCTFELIKNILKELVRKCDILINYEIARKG